MKSLRFFPVLIAVLLLQFPAIRIAIAQADSKQAGAGPQLAIIDTDIGDDIDDAFALALALRSPEVEILGITTAWGDTTLRARLTQRFLKENGAPEMPIAVGVPTRSNANFSQARWAQD